MTRPSDVPRRPGALNEANSSTMRDKMLEEVVGLRSVAEAFQWASSGMRRKNNLAAEDVVAVEQAFAEKMKLFEEPRTDTPGADLTAETDLIGTPKPEALPIG